MKNANKKGFTLIEMLVVVLIIGILAAVALPQYFKAVEKSRATEALSVLGSIAAAQERYRLSTSENTYTNEFGDFDISFTGSNGSDAAGDSFNTKNFTITLSGGTGADAYVIAERNGGGNEASTYSITRVYRSGAVTCSDSENTGGVCRSLGIAAAAAAAPANP